MLFTFEPYMTFVVFILSCYKHKAKSQTLDPLRYKIVEHSPFGSTIADLIRDLDLRSRYSADIIGRLEFRILTQSGGSAAATSANIGGASQSQGQFSIDSKSGVVMTSYSSPLDR